MADVRMMHFVHLWLMVGGRGEWKGAKEMGGKGMNLVSDFSKASRFDAFQFTSIHRRTRSKAYGRQNYHRVFPVLVVSHAGMIGPVTSSISCRKPSPEGVSPVPGHRDLSVSNIQIDISLPLASFA
jgi:hypothetical protein